MEKLENKKAWILLTLLKVDNKKKLKFIQNKTFEKILEPKIQENNEVLENHIKYMQKNNIDIVTFNEKLYPQNLKNIYDPPIALYVKGNKEILNLKNIAIVGSRECSEYGKKMAQDIAKNLVRQKINIVSGLARGIDTNSHIGALNQQGITIAVLGHGLDIIYPKENFQISNKIINSKGALITEFPLGTKLNKINFPRRNRIISGISQAVIVVEAKKESGSLITADFALEQGRDVFCVPGNIDSIYSEGTNNLIKQGAHIFTNCDDILQNIY